VEDEDWSLSWKRHWGPDPIGETLLVLPAWLDVPPEAAGRRVIRLDPGPAFGTGSHPSTRLCLEGMEALAAARVQAGAAGEVAPLAGWRVADLGCGSGLLGLAAIALGAAEVLAVDTDPLAIRATHDNTALNGFAGLTVAIVALPLSMAIATGSGAKPEHGLIAAVIVGFIVSALGGSRFQIGGPAGAFIVLVASIIGMHGHQGFLAATIMAGCLLLLIGYLQLGIYIKYIPYPVTIGFTAGIGVIIFAAEIKDFFGLTLAAEPGPLIPKIAALWNAAGTVNWAAAVVGALCLATILILRRLAPRFPCAWINTQ
jgi:hypothetical protein